MIVPILNDFTNLIKINLYFKKCSEQKVLQAFLFSSFGIFNRKVNSGSHIMAFRLCLKMTIVPLICVEKTLE